MTPCRSKVQRVQGPTGPRGLTVAVVCLVILCAGASGASAQSAQETIAEIRVHGNHLATTEEIVTLAAVAIGAPFTATTLDDIERRLRASNRFQGVDVLKRFASISDLSRIAIVIIVNEGPVRVVLEREGDEEVARVLRRRGFGNLMWLPILDGEDGYGLTYGVTVSKVNVLGARSRLAVPLSWGGTRRAAVELERNFEGGPLTRIEAGAAIQRRTNPAFDLADTRKKAWMRLERSFGPVRLGATGGWDRVRFDDLEDDFVTTSGDVTLDTRIDPGFPRNAVYLSAALDRVQFSAGHSLYRTRLDGRGYLGLIGQTVLAVRAAREAANGPQPRYLRPLLGGWSSLRGFEAGAFHGDIVVTGSAELFVPLTSPLNVGRVGVSTFVDTGVAYDHGYAFSDQTRRTGYGGSLWFTATGFKLSFSVAHGRGAKTRVNFGGGFTF